MEENSCGAVQSSCCVQSSNNVIFDSVSRILVLNTGNCVLLLFLQILYLYYEILFTSIL